MGKPMLCLSILVLFVSAVYSDILELDSFLLDALDDTRLALETAKTIEVKKIAKKTSNRGTSVIDKSVTKVTRFKPGSGGGWWGGGARRRFSVRRRRRVRPEVKPRPVRPKKKAPLNKFLQATNQIEKGVRDAGVMGRGQNVNTLKQHVQKACNSKKFIFARQMLGHAIYNYAKAKSSKRRGRRSTTSTAATILNDIKTKIGDGKFQQLMALDAPVTLGFAMDTTGSMISEIGASIQIATDITNWRRQFEFKVDYVLSPFNDPPQSLGYTIQHGPATYFEPSKKLQFLQKLGTLKAVGGGDCEELAIEGIQNIFSTSLQYLSPIYVFTDAGAKDATVDNVEALKEMADFYQSAINFFLSNAGCMNKKAISLYQSLAEATGGQILYFSGTSTLTKMSNFVTNGLIGGTGIPVIPYGRQRRSTRSLQYSIQIDNSIDTLSATVMTDASSSGVTLTNPSGVLQVDSRVNTGKGSLFLVKKPASGIWKLTVPPSSSGNQFVTARGISEENIDFEFFFIVESRMGRRSKQILTKSPLKGKRTSVVITVPAHAKTIPSSYKLHIVNNAFKLPKTISIRQRGRSPGRYKGEFSPPTHDFKMILEGKTKEGVLFKRMCFGIVKPSTALIHIFSAPRGFVIHAGSSRTTTILFAANNFGSTEAFDVRVKDLKKSVKRYNKRLFVVSNRMALFPIAFKAPPGAKYGATHDVVVSIVGQRSKERANILIQLLVV
eukprot:gene15844-17441_t